MKSNPKIGLKSNAHSLPGYTHPQPRCCHPGWKMEMEMETVLWTLNVAAKCSIAVSQDMPKRAETGISVRLLCVSNFVLCILYFVSWTLANEVAKWSRKCKQSQMEIQLLKRLVHCWIRQNLHISYLFVGLGPGLKAETECHKESLHIEGYMHSYCLVINFQS